VCVCVYIHTYTYTYKHVWPFCALVYHHARIQWHGRTSPGTRRFSLTSLKKELMNFCFSFSMRIWSTTLKAAPRAREHGGREQEVERVKRKRHTHVNIRSHTQCALFTHLCACQGQCRPNARPLPDRMMDPHSALPSENVMSDKTRTIRLNMMLSTAVT